MKEQNKVIKAYVLLALVYCLLTLAHLVRHGTPFSELVQNVLLGGMILAFLGVVTFSLYIWIYRPFAPVGWVKVFLFISTVLTMVILLSDRLGVAG